MTKKFISKFFTTNRSPLPSVSHSQELPLLLSQTDLSQESHDKMKNARHFSSRVPTFIMILILVITCSFSFIVVSLDSEADWTNRVSGEVNLLLTPFINAGNISKARDLAKVNIFPEIISYSGFLTVDDICRSHLFFWFFPAASGNLSAPLILWHGGGPGTSGLFSLFQGTGPILLDGTGESWLRNEYAWTGSRSVLYLDSPVGTGFSYSEKGEACYATSSDDVAESVIIALRQFFQLFPEYQRSDFYISTSSYGGKFIPMIAKRIANENELDGLSGNSNLTSIKLKGLISMSGFSDPIHQIDYGEFYFNMGFINARQMKYFLSKEALAKSYIRSKHFYEAFEVIDPLVVGIGDSPSYLKNLTGIDHPYNFYEDLNNPKAAIGMYRPNKFLNLEWVQKAIHVNSSALGRGFSLSSSTVYRVLASDIYKSVGNVVEDLLDNGYKFLFTSGQMDLIVPHTTVVKFLNELRWNGHYKFKSAGNFRYKYNDSVIGYGKSWGNLTYIMFRNVGHHPFIDQPEWTRDVVLKFTE